MEKLTDGELDSVFKNAAEGITPPFDPAAWDAMAQKMNAPRPAPLWRRWTPILVLGTTIFFTGVWVGRTSTESDSPELTEKKNVVEANEKSNYAEALSGNNELSELEVLPEVKNNVNKKSTVRVKLVSEYPSQNLTSQEKPNEQKNLHEIKEEEFTEVVGVISLGHEVQLKDSLIENEVIDSIALVKSAVDSLDMSKEMNDKQSGSRVCGLFIRLLASPDLSSIKFGPAELGSNIGLVGEFSLSNKFSLSTGIIRARKNYESYQEEAYGNNARHLQGSCTILDLPLNLTYNFPSQRKLSGYVTAGASSYLMLHEDYIYTIKSSSGDRVYPSEAIRKNNEWFKVLNIAFGVQYKLAPRWQIQLEPFIKAPLADLGERNVRLSSLGVFTGLRYQLHSTIKHP
ncbi:MAG: PorT family protein [Cyclobacteriaceae bacterium]|nr:PorT family protein [Cyclobacteriaceae bacterium]